MKPGITRTLELPESVPAPITAGQELGSLTLESGGKILARIPLTAEQSVERLTFWDLFCRILLGKETPSGGGRCATAGSS